MKKTVIIINGIGTSGKDTFVEIVNKLFSNSVINVSSITVIRKVAEILGADIEKKDPLCRKFLHELKMLSTAYNDFPFNWMMKKIELFKDLPDFNILFIHSREIAEIERLISTGRKDSDIDIFSLLVKKDSSKPIEGLDLTDSEEIFNYDYDFIIENNGTLEDLEEKAKNFINVLLNKPKN